MQNQKALTLIEITIVLIIIGILAAMAVVIPNKQVEKAQATEAQTQLKIIWAAEKDYYIYYGRYIDDWKNLDITNPNLNPDKHFVYAIQLNPLIIKATHKDKPTGFQIDTDGEISAF